MSNLRSCLPLKQHFRRSLGVCKEFTPPQTCLIAFATCAVIFYQRLLPEVRDRRLLRQLQPRVESVADRFAHLDPAVSSRSFCAKRTSKVLSLLQWGTLPERNIWSPATSRGCDPDSAPGLGHGCSEASAV